MPTPTSSIRAWSTAGLLASLLLAGCVVAPPPRRVAAPPPPEPSPPVTDVYAYPTRGQTPEQQDRDHYECSLWASQQTGFDPSAPGVPAEERVRVVSGPPSGAGTAIGAVTGAIIGAAISPRWQAAPGALAGALVGGAIGSASDAANAQQTQTVLVADRRAQAAQAHRATNYRRAIGACLDARGYSVR
ncbi:MAG: glycine zipper 2TM domain-containing protein [Gammaproteobacteria bacterium]|nr:glycine zipper 2TM domain-containing protein [Gammaproteobacteria bacterium]MBV9619758.1 glycine zipper 2TM domain-containing protein [Gammaproteobacteria bacterium]